MRRMAISAGALASSAGEPIYNASQLQNTQIDMDLDMAPTGDVLVYDGTQWTWSTAGGGYEWTYAQFKFDR
jgi:hypothetical protein